MTDAAVRTMEAEPLKAGQEDVTNRRSCGGAGRVSGWRTASFLLSVFLCLTVIFSFSFILPCPVRSQYQRWWNLHLPSAEPCNFLSVADTNGDKVLDVLLTFHSSEGRMNHTCPAEGSSSSSCLFLLAVDGTDGGPLWETPLSGGFVWAQCGLGGVGKKVCVVAHTDGLACINMYTGTVLWRLSRSVVPNATPPVVSLPDLDDDDISELAVLSSSPSQTDHQAELLFISGKLGAVIGSQVKVGVVLSHLQYSTVSGAQYLLLHTGEGLDAVGVWRLAGRARVNLDARLNQEKSWEKQANVSGSVRLYESRSLRGVYRVEGKSSSSAPPLLLHTESGLVLFNPQTLAVAWTTNISNLLSTPTFGHYNKDGILDVILEEDLNNASKRVVIIDGQTGSVLWQVTLKFPVPNPPPASVLTLNYYSVFMMWGEQVNETNSVDNKLFTYLLYPLHSDVLLKRRNAADNISTFKASLLERGRHACYLTLSRSNGSLVLTKRKIKDDVPESRVLSVGVAEGGGEDVPRQWAKTVKEDFKRLRFGDIQ